MSMVARCALVLVLIVAVPTTASPQLLSSVLPLAPLTSSVLNKLDPLTQRQLTNVFGRSRVIVRATDGTAPSLLLPILQSVGGIVYKTLTVVNAHAVELPNAALLTVAANPLVARVSLDRRIFGAMERTSSTIGATALRQTLGYDGRGIGVAIVDSGITAWHDDLTGDAPVQRVHRFVDFVNGRGIAYDDYGHGTHVAGIVAGNGADSSGARTGIAPDAHLVVMKVLDRAGRGHISSVIAALDHLIANRHVFDVRVVNLSVAAGVFESYSTDPLTLAAKRAVDAGIVVVAAAGNYGRDKHGKKLYGGITAPGNAPWVLTVGASSHSGTVDRADDTIALFSSRGPTAIDREAKPDLVAPGVGIESLSDPLSAFYTTKSAYLLRGTALTAYLPYLSLSGTSMAAPVVTGTIALMLQANPSLTPARVKAILQYTAQKYQGYDVMTQGAGFLDAQAAVNLAAWFTDASNVPDVADPRWQMWNAEHTSDGHHQGVWSTTDDDSVVWGTNDDDSVVWGTSCSDAACEPVVWGNP
jgi:serine protease AprX